MTLRAVPTSQREVNAFITALHRTHKRVRGGKFFIAVSDGARVVGVAAVGRPKSRELQKDVTALEVTRVCTDGTRNACSKLYGLARRVAGILGYRLLWTYTGLEEGGASLRGAGFALDGQTRGGSWSCPTRPRSDSAPVAPKLRWKCGLETEATE